ncbi:AAA domain-containing protein [Aromatoleum toluvorans]|uniref:AAA domain-containing protein n=1 Tax=Aromatoleum toluvorans TaxID=92002 RepID=A0ABX1PTZ1_9RHOO|nr:AAA family ATPase [Aromatoleum toluvorans]NMG42904.1 AAA domain-containing protein [Aromatoleum toluvorans]
MPTVRPSVPDLHGRLAGLVATLERGLVERSHVVRLALLAALAGEHTLLIGPPGTAKSELARRLHLAFRDARYFERLLTRFSVPEELFGPLSIQALEQDRYERHTAGFLPDASIAFIDEVFKANSAILNALLTLLNEREFDNGAGRQRCPLISAIGATNEVPEDEIAEAFFDRFLLRVTVAPVSAEGFAALLGADPVRGWQAPEDAATLGAADLDALGAAAARVALPAEVTAMFAELRAHLGAAEVYVSDRRWVKAARLLRIAAASEGRGAVSLWDLLLLPWCTAPDAPRQAALGDWLCTRLGVREAFAPPRVTRIVEAFEAQLQAERNANDLDYDESGRLRFSATDLADEIGDAKRGAQALRLTHTRQRRYGSAHIGARTRQIDELVARLDGYAAELDARRRDLAEYHARSLWLDAALAARAEESLAGTARVIADLRERICEARAGFEALPRLPAGEGGEVPAPVRHEPLSAA